LCLAQERDRSRRGAVADNLLSADRAAISQSCRVLAANAIEYYGAELVTVAPTLSARVATTGELVARHGYVLIPPFDDRTVIAGQGTIGLEIAADCPAG